MSSKKTIACAIIATAVIATTTLGFATSASADAPHTGGQDGSGSPNYFYSQFLSYASSNPNLDYGSRIIRDVAFQSSAVAGAALTEGADDVLTSMPFAGAALTETPTTKIGTLRSFSAPPQSTGSSSDSAGSALVQVRSGVNALSKVPAKVIDDELGGLTLLPGSYVTAGAASLTSDLILDGNFDKNSKFVITSGAAFTAAASVNVILENGAQASNVVWIVPAAATLGASDQFAGNIVSAAAVTVGASTIVNGSIFADAAVTLGASAEVGLRFDTNTFDTVPTGVVNVSGANYGNGYGYGYDVTIAGTPDKYVSPVPGS